MTPVIGIVSCGFSGNRQFVPQTYIHAIESSGGIPLVIPCAAASTAYSSYIHICDGFLFCGGDDITPCLFGEELYTAIGTTDIDTDLFHLSFMQEVLHSSLPLLAICRGMQVLNLCLDGTIYQDLSLCSAPVQNHIQLSQKRGDICHRVCFSPNSILYNIFGDSAYTNTFHHQCIHLLGHHLHIAGVTSDGVIEAIESDSHAFVIGVQWHPECMCDTTASMKKLFSELINYAKNAKTIYLV